MESIEIRLDIEALISRVQDLLKEGEKNLINALERAIEFSLTSEFNLQLNNYLKKDVCVKVYDNYFTKRTASINDLVSSGYDTWYLRIQITTHKESDFIDNMNINPIGFSLESIKYGYGIEQKIKIKKKLLKTQVNYTIEMLHFVLRNEVFKIFQLVELDELKGLILCNLCEGPRLRGFEIVSFTDAITGDKYFCSCASLYHEELIKQANIIKGNYVSGSWPHQICEILNESKYRQGICHKCVALNEGSEKAIELYGDAVMFNQRPYISQMMFEKQITEATAVADIRELLGISRWKSEAMLYRVIKSIFPGHEIQREASPYWLDRQRIDIYLPELKLAIEYQGEQHYRPVVAFGGEEAFERNKERDELKKQKCLYNGVNVVYFSYKDSISMDYVKNRLRKYLT